MATKAREDNASAHNTLGNEKVKAGDKGEKKGDQIRGKAKKGERRYATGGMLKTVKERGGDGGTEDKGNYVKRLKSCGISIKKYIRKNISG